MTSNLNYINQRLSLRKPQKVSLEILAKLVDSIDLNKTTPIDDALKAFNNAGEFNKLLSFERDFPSVAFALATGVGKTRLMGAFISYLYKEKGLRNFLVLAPNLTIYNKLIADFSNASNPKYVFNGVQLEPRVITGDNYLKTNTVKYSSNRYGQSALFEDEVTINVFNISKINAESRGGKAPKIRRMSEYFGESYFQFLQNTEDLVLIMDESHHYRASRGMDVLNELKPILGLELTATPTLTDGTPFKNIVCEYTLAHAIKDGYVKEPAAATRKNLTKKQLKDLTPEELDKMKMLDAMHVHEITKTNLEIYARNHKRKLVRPFVLVVAQDTTHAEELKQLIQSDEFCDGLYKDKVFEIHSNQRGAEKEENIQKLLELEDPRNKYEIVIHCNMLKEGWDVTNLYTIVPLRSFAASILTEQTLGRGLRLPYGEITGVSEVDTLTVIAHESFEDLIKKASDPNSIIMKQYFIDPENEIYKKNQEVISALTPTEADFHQQEQEISELKDEKVKKVEQEKLSIKKEVFTSCFDNEDLDSIADLSTADVKKKIKKSIKEKISQGSLFTSLEEKQIDEVFEGCYQKITESIIKKTIEIPRITIQLKNDTEYGFKDFKLDTKTMAKFPPVEEEILVRYLQEQKKTFIHSVSNNSSSGEQSWLKTLISELLNYDEVDYDEHGDLLYSLAEDALNHLRSYLKDDSKIENVIQYYRVKIAEFIYTQMMENFYCKSGSFEDVDVQSFSKIENHNYSKFKNEDIYDSRDHVANKSELLSRVFDFYKKSCHTLYKYDSMPEKEFASMLDEDDKVLKWLRPSIKQFNIYWDHHSRLYEPDFVVETTDKLLLVEVKASNELDSPDVIEKAKAALEYCRIATKHGDKTGKKPWAYLLIPHDEITTTRDISYFVHWSNSPS